LSQGVTRPAQAKHDGPQLPNQATRRSVRFMQANLDVIGPEMAMGDPVPAFWFASWCRTSGSRPARVTIRPDDTWRTTRAVTAFGLARQASSASRAANRLR